MRHFRTVGIKSHRRLRIKTPSARNATGTVYYLADGLGSTMATTDASGNVVNTYTYHPYGATSSSTGSQPNPSSSQGSRPTRQACSTCVHATTTLRRGRSYRRTRWVSAQVGRVARTSMPMATLRC